MAAKITKTSLILGFGLLLSAGVIVAQDSIVQETVRLEIELLSSSGHPDFRGIDVASGNLLVEIYENRRFRPAWTDLDQVDELLTAIEATAADGLDPADYHLEQVRTGYRQLLAGDVTTAIARAELDVLFTDSLIRLVYHQRFGKLNPYTLDPQWNFRRDLDGVSAAAAIQSMIDADSLLDRLQTLFPRGRIYEQLRQNLARYRDIEANGGWPELPEGPTLKSGMVDDRVPVLARRLARYDKAGEEHFNLVSALHKAVRGSDVEGALYWLARMIQGGEDPMYLARRVVRMAAEDIGLADPRALTITLAAKEAYHFLGSPEGELALVEAVIYLASAPKSNRIYAAWGKAQAAAREYPAEPVPKHIRNAPTRLMKNLGYGEGYRYDHAEGGHAAGQEYLPEALRGARWYEPGPQGFEKTVAERLAWWAEQKNKAG